MSYGQQKPWSGMYMQSTTYRNDFNRLGISPRQRRGDHVHNASMRADIPAGTYRPTMYDQLESPRRERIPKRGTEWIGGRRYDNEPREGRHDMYERQRRIDMSPERMFNSETIIGIPYKERQLEAVPYASNIRRRQTFTQGEVPRYNPNFSRKPKDDLDPYGFGRYSSIGQEYNHVYDIRDPYEYMERPYVSLPYINPHRPYLVNQDDYYNYGRHTSIGQEASRDYGQIVPYRSKQSEPYPRSKQVEPLPPLDTKQPKHWMIHEEDNEKTQIQSNSPRNVDPYNYGRYTSVGQYDRGRNGSPERLDRGRNGSPERERRFDQFREPNDRYDRYDYPREPVRDKYDERYEKPRDPILDGYANHKMADRTTQKDYGEFMLEKIKQDELRRNLDFPKQDIPAAQSGGVYLFIRTDKGALTEIRKALQEGRSVLANSGGQLKGIAHSDQIKLLEGHHGWNIRYPVTRRGEYWMERTDSNPAINNIIIVLEFSDVSHADLWLMTSKFKSMQFPEPYGFESFIVPINYNPTYAGYTFLLTEYPEAFIELVRDKYLPRLRTLLGRFYKYDDQLTIQFLSRGLPREEMQKSRGNWINRRSSIIGIRFRNEYDAMDFWRDTEFRSIREEIKQLVDRDPYQPPDKWFHPISVVFTLNEVRV